MRSKKGTGAEWVSFMVQIGLFTLGFVVVLFLIGLYAPSGSGKVYGKPLRSQYEGKSAGEQATGRTSIDAPKPAGLMELVGTSASNSQEKRGNGA